MSTLHLVRTSDFTSSHFASALQVINTNDALVLLDDGCYNIKHSLIHSDIIKQLMAKQQCYVVNEHCQARAITISTTLQAIPLSQLVELSFQYNKVMTWQ